MIILLADSGSSKTDWLLRRTSNGTLHRFASSGLNPCLMTDEEIVCRLREEVLPELASQMSPVAIDRIDFYGAGCRPDQLERMSALLCSTLYAAEAEVASDLLGAARALCGSEAGIVGIMGTGSGSALYDGVRFVQQTPSLGYILGDEGSGAVLGRRLLADVFKRQLPDHILAAFRAESPLTIDEAIRRVYRDAAPNRFLAQFTHFLAAHRTDASVHQLLVDEFRRFFLRNIAAYSHPELPVHLVGSIAYVFKSELCEAAQDCGFTVGRILRSPIDALG